MTLAQYLEDRKCAQVEFAREAGLSTSYVNEIVRGVKTPSLAVAVKIARITNGSVSIDSLLPVEKIAAPDDEQGTEVEAPTDASETVASEEDAA